MYQENDNITQGRQLLLQRSKKRAFDCLYKKEFSRAFAHFIVVLTIDPDDEDMMNLLLYVLNMLTNELEEVENWDEILMCYQQILEVLPHCAQILHGLATVLFKLGHLESATKYFRKAYKENPFFTPSLYCIDNIKNKLVERWHFTMLNDRKRNSAFAVAIQQAVKDGYKHVLDIGSGTGILSMIAVDAGAEKVYACEGNQVMFEIMQNVVEANKKDIKLLNKLSYDINIPADLPERVNLVVTETFDAGFFGEHVLETLNHAWDKLLRPNAALEKSDCSSAITDSNCNSTEKPNSKVIPQSAVLWAVPIECQRIRKELWASTESLETLGLCNAQVTASFSSDEPYSTERLSHIEGGYTALCAPQQILNVNFSHLQQIKDLLSGKSLNLEFNCTANGRVDAIVVWFDLNLYDRVKLSTEPENNEGCWEQALFPVLPQHSQGQSCIVNLDDLLSVEFYCKGHLTLKKVVTSSAVANGVDNLPVESTVVQSLNSLSSTGVLKLDLISKCPSEKMPLVVDLSTVPVLGLKALKDGAHQLVILPSMNLLDVTKLQNMCSLPREKLKVMSHEDISKEPLACDILIVEPVEMCGLLRKNIFEDIALMRNCSTSSNMTVYPGQLTIFISLIESSILCDRVKIASDEKCLGYKISKFLNTYQSNIHQDLQLPVLQHNRLCDPVQLCQIDLSTLMLEKNKLQSFIEFHGTCQVKITRSGQVTAIPYWFDLHYDPSTVVNTSHPDSLWKQAAVIPEAIQVTEGEQVTLTWTCRNSCLYVSLKT